MFLGKGFQRSYPSQQAMCVTSNETEQISSGHGIAYFLKVVEGVQCEIVSVFVVQQEVGTQASFPGVRWPQLVGASSMPGSVETPVSI